MAALKSSPTAFQSVQSAYSSETLDGSSLVGVFSAPVKSKMRAMPSQTGLREVRTIRILRLVLPPWAGLIALRLTSILPFALTAIRGLPQYHHGSSTCWHSITAVELTATPAHVCIHRPSITPDPRSPSAGCSSRRKVDAVGFDREVVHSSLSPNCVMLRGSWPLGR